jgi:two-component system, chemotaxis family, sensor kinase CheA
VNGAPHSDPRWQQLLAAFSAELEERTRAFNQLLLRLEGGADDTARSEIFDALFREAHSVKGAARMVALPQMEQLAHALEGALQTARAAGGTPPPPWFDVLYRAVDTLSELQRASKEQDSSASPDFDALLETLRTDPTAAVIPEAETIAAAIPEVTPSPSVQLAPDVPPPDAPPSGASPVVPVETEPAARNRSTARAGSDTVRVDVDKLDALLAQAGELAVTNIRVEQRSRDSADLRRELDAWRRDWRAARALRRRVDAATRDDVFVTPDGVERRVRAQRDLDMLLSVMDRLDRQAEALLERSETLAGRLRLDASQLSTVTRTVEDTVMAVRLLPAGAVFVPFERMVRDLGREHGKEVRLLIHGAETEIDRQILEEVRDPLMHLLRNAVDHGVEPPQERVAHGKPREATIRLSADQRGGFVEVLVEDDGGGIDPAGLRRRALDVGLLTPDQAAVMDDSAATDLIFRRGFSSRTTVTETSGRGVGMDVVREHIDRLGGRVEVQSVSGKGARFSLIVPLTLATTRAVLVEQGETLCAVPSAAIERMGRVRRTQLVRLEGRQVLVIEGRPAPAAELADALQQPAGAWADEYRPYFMLQQGEQRVVLLADRLVGEQEVVVKHLGWPLVRVRNVSGAAVLGSGQTAMILNPADLLKSGLAAAGSGMAALDDVAVPERRRTQVLVVDDSLTTRTLERTILEAAGYDVAVASDGQDALRVLRSSPIDLVVSDVQMPNLDGFGLTAEIRRDPQLKGVPVVLVTSLDSPEHREQGSAAGADAYIVKGAFDQGQLLETIGRLL